MITPIEQFRIYEGCGAAVALRVEKWSGDLALQADLSSIAYRVYDLTRGGALTGSGSLVVAATVYDTVQSGGGWPYEAGYNFRAILPATCFPDGGRTYQIQLLFTPVVGERFAWVGRVWAEDLLGE